MKQHEINGNEEFFTVMLDVLKDGGTWGWPSENEYFVLKEGKYYGTPAGLKKVKEIISPEYYKKYFGLIEKKD